MLKCIICYKELTLVQHILQEEMCKEHYEKYEGYSLIEKKKAIRV